MRIRQIKPTFWSDEVVSALPEGTRLFFIGVWMLADDAGWLRWNVAEIALSLYGYQARNIRERRVSTMGSQLVEVGRIEIAECGHAFVPHLRAHQRFSAPEKQVRTIEREHLSEVPIGVTRGSPRKPAEARNGTERYGTLRNVAGAPAREAAGAHVAPGGSPKGLKEALGPYDEMLVRQRRET